MDAAQFIFVGIGRRIYFVNNQYEEVPSEHSATRQGLAAIVLEVDVLKPLYPANWAEGRIVLIPIRMSNGRESDYIGRQGVYFTNRAVIYDEIAEETPQAAKRLSKPLLAHTPSTLPAKIGAKENPLPLSFVEAVVESISKRLARERSDRR